MKPIKTALCSFGMSGWVFHAPFIHAHPGFELYGVVERTKNLAAEKYPGIHTFRSIEEMLQDKDIELVIVNTPNYTHYDYAKQSLEAGKHVVVEKPFTLYAKEATQLIELAAAQGKKLTVYQNRRWDSDYKTVAAVVEKKLLGDIAEAEIHFDRFKEDIGPKLHKETPGPGTGLLYDLGSHMIDQAIQLFGIPKKVFADVGIIRPVSKVADYMELLLFYDTLRVRLKASYLVKEILPAYIFHGAKGSFIKPRADVQERDLQAEKNVLDADWGEEASEGKGLLHTEINGDSTRGYLPSQKGNYMDFYAGLYKAIRENGPLPVAAEEAREVISIIEAAYRSVAENRIIDL